jgi:hypothetical protein
MVIYHDGIIRGVRWSKKEIGKQFEEIFDKEMKVENFKKKYNELDNKDDYCFYVYMDSSDSYNRDPSTSDYWWHIRKETLEKWMNHDDSYKNDL